MGNVSIVLFDKAAATKRWLVMQGGDDLDRAAAEDVYKENSPGASSLWTPRVLHHELQPADRPPARRLRSRPGQHLNLGIHHFNIDYFSFKNYILD